MISKWFCDTSDKKARSYKKFKWKELTNFGMNCVRIKFEQKIIILIAVAPTSKRELISLTVQTSLQKVYLMRAHFIYGMGWILNIHKCYTAVKKSVKFLKCLY